MVPRIHSHLRSTRGRSFQLSKLRTSKDYLYRKVSGQSCLFAKEFATSLLDKTELFSVVERRKKYLLVILIHNLALHITELF